MNELISVGILRDGNQLSSAVVIRETDGTKRVLGVSKRAMDPAVTLHEEEVRHLLATLEVQSDIMVRDAVCHHRNGTQENTRKLAELICASDVTATPVLYNAKDATDLATWWADQSRL